MLPSERTGSNGHKLKHRRLCLNNRKLFCTVWAIEHWHSLPREAALSPSLEILKNASAWSWTTCFKWPCWNGVVWDQMDPVVTSNLKHPVKCIYDMLHCSDLAKQDYTYDFYGTTVDAGMRYNLFLLCPKKDKFTGIK